jgi:hypothetical protein
VSSIDMAQIVFGIGSEIANGIVSNPKGYYSFANGTFQAYTKSLPRSYHMAAGGLRTASRVSTGLKIGGYGLGLWSGYETWNDYNDGKMTGTRFAIEEGSNAISTFGGFYGAMWGIGWESGRVITGIPAYREYVRPHLQDFFGFQRDEY